MRSHAIGFPRATADPAGPCPSGGPYTGGAATSNWTPGASFRSFCGFSTMATWWGPWPCFLVANMQPLLR